MEKIIFDLYDEPIKIKTRVCNKCKEELPLEAFGSNPQYAEGRRHECKKCRNGLLKDVKQYLNIPIPKDYVCPGCLITEEELRKRKKLKSTKKVKRIWCADHDHNTKLFRGFICDNCNKALGLTKDNPETLKRLISYLKGKNRIKITTLNFKVAKKKVKIVRRKGKVAKKGKE